MGPSTTESYPSGLDPTGHSSAITADPSLLPGGTLTRTEYLSYAVFGRN